MGLGITNNALSNVQKQKVNLNRDALPVVIATWDVKNATKKAWETMENHESSLDAIEKGCMIEEANEKIKLVDFEIDIKPRTMTKPSDHTPIIIEILDL